MELTEIEENYIQRIPLALGCKSLCDCGIPLALGCKSLCDCGIPLEVIIYVILPYLQYKYYYYKKDNTINIKTLFGYFKSDYNRTIWLIWRGLYCKYEICELKEYPLLTSLTLNYCKDTFNLIECPLITSLSLNCCYRINELKEYSYLTSLTLKHTAISELKEYPLLTSLLYNIII